MVTFQTVYFTALGLTAASGVAASAIVTLGDTARNAGQRAVAVRLAQIAVIGATALAAMLGGFTN